MRFGTNVHPETSSMPRKIYVLKKRQYVLPKKNIIILFLWLGSIFILPWRWKHCIAPKYVYTPIRRTQKPHDFENLKPRRIETFLNKSCFGVQPFQSYRMGVLITSCGVRLLNPSCCERRLSNHCWRMFLLLCCNSQCSWCSDMRL
jgi:hypothetical protein